MNIVALDIAMIIHHNIYTNIANIIIQIKYLVF